jgi:hypothetical protein
MEIPKNDYERIAALIDSAASPVGIDAKRTHVMILHKLERIEHRLTVVESRLAQSAPTGDEGI